MKIVICGGGIIGAATAYFLSKRGADVTVVERTGVACASSGKAGAFLALDWCAGGALDQLARRSFVLHAKLAEDLDIEGDWGYQRVETYGGYTTGSRTVRHRPTREWLSERVAVTGALGSPATTATVHPRLLTEALIRAAQRQGAELRLGRVTGIVRDDSGTAVRGVEVTDAHSGESIYAADAVVIAMGPWSIEAAGWLPLPAIHAYKGHSVIYRTGDSIPPEALFLEYQTPTGSVLTPEFFPRADGTMYVAYSATQDALPSDPADVQADPHAIEQLETICEQVAPALSRATVITRQACYRPVTDDGLPVIGRVPGVAGAYLATGHSVWGVLNGPATGEALSELILDGAAQNVDLRPFDPARLRPVRR